jgi:single-strand DNA-binding protein
VEGRIQTRSWEGQDGQKRRVTEIIANDVQFLEPRGAGGNAGGSAAPVRTGAAHDDIPAPDDAPRDVDPDEIPF